MNLATRARDGALLLLIAVPLLVAGCGASTGPSSSRVASGSAAPPGASSSAVSLTSSPNAPSESVTPAPIPGAPVRPRGTAQEATLVRVVDGDTIRVLVGGVDERVRYIGMDTPELNTTSRATPEPYAAAATEANARLLARGRIVLEKDVSERDRYGRLLRNVWVERDGAWTFVNLALVAEGFAQVATYPPDVAYADVLRAAQGAAREAGRGLWGGPPP